MKPIVIVQHEADTGPGHFERYLLGRHLPSEIVRVFAGESIPRTAGRYAGICSLGGSMSIDSQPGKGTTLRIQFPQSAVA